MPDRWHWAVVHRGDPFAVALANRHYSRRRRAATVGPPGAPVVLRTPEGDAFWLSARSDYEGMDGSGWAWRNCYFRNESSHLSSVLIREAIAVTRHVFGEPPDDGMVTYIDPAKVASRNPGYCYLVAGFEPSGWTAGGHGRPRLRRLRIAPEMMPDPLPGLVLAPMIPGVEAR